MTNLDYAPPLLASRPIYLPLPLIKADIIKETLAKGDRDGTTSVIQVRACRSLLSLEGNFALSIASASVVV